MRTFALICLFVGVSSCASHPSLGAPVDDAARRTALLQGYQRPRVQRVVYRTLISWPGREVSVTEVVKPSPDGGFSVAGISDIGSTLYAVQVAPDGRGHVLSKSLPFSDRWLLDGLVAELLIPWNGPDETCRLFLDRRSGSGSSYTLVRSVGDDTQVFLFDGGGHWQSLQRFSGGRLRCRASLEWDAEALPQRMQVDNPGEHYHVVRERVSLQSVHR